MVMRPAQGAPFTGHHSYFPIFRCCGQTRPPIARDTRVQTPVHNFMLPKAVSNVLVVTPTTPMVSAAMTERQGISVWDQYFTGKEHILFPKLRLGRPAIWFRL